MSKRPSSQRERANPHGASRPDSRSEQACNDQTEGSNRNIALTLKHFNHRNERAAASADGKRLYLKLGDEVNHLRHEEWGMGMVVEVMTSSIPGGTCLARVRFQDGQLRCFNNDLDNEACCYYFGVRRYWNPTHGFDAIRAKFFLRG